MRAAVLYLSLSACGRLWFDAVGGSSDGGTSDGVADGTVAQSCSATLVNGLNVPGPVANIVAAEMPSGFAIGFLNSPSSVLQGVTLDASLVPNRTNPAQTSPSIGTLIPYAGASLYWDGTNLDGSTSVFEDGSCYFKTFMPDMSAYALADQRIACAAGEPSVAHADQLVVSTYFGGNAHTYAQLDNTGWANSSDLPLGNAASVIVSASIASGTPNALLASATDTNVCEVFTVPAGASSTLANACSNPRAYRGNASNEYYVAYKTAGAIVVRTIVETGGITLGPMISLGNVGTDPQLMTSSAVLYVVFETTTSLGIRPLGGPTDLAISGLPAGTPDAFETAGPYAFAAFGSELYAVHCP